MHEKKNGLKSYGGKENEELGMRNYELCESEHDFGEEKCSIPNSSFLILNSSLLIPHS